MTDDMDRYDDILPDGAVPMCGFRVLSYLKTDGRVGYKFAQVGDVDAGHLVGLLELIKHEVCTLALSPKRGD